MKMEYILIKKEKFRIHKEQNDIIYEIVPSPFKLIKDNFKNVEVEPDRDNKDKIVRSNWKGNFYNNQKKISFSIKQYSKQKLSYLTIYIKRNSKVNVNIMELIDKDINNIMSDYYIIITSYDSISEFYCNKIYNKLNRFERKLRELLFNIYTFHYGINYYDQKFSNDLKEKIKTDKSIYSESKSIEKVKQALYELTYNDIMNLLFTPKWLKEDEENKIDLAKKIHDESLSQQELVKIIENIKPKSDWERLFLPYIGEIENFEETINELRKLRNRVAHCKFFRQKHYERCLDILKIVNKEMDKALKEVMKINFQKLNVEYTNNQLRATIENVSKSLREIGETLSNYSKLVISTAGLSIINIIKDSLGNLKIPTINSDICTKIPIKKFKYLNNKKYIKKND